MKTSHLTVLLAALSLAAAVAAGPAATPVTDTLHGITLTDEYRWMEDPARAGEMGEWVLAESAKARAALQALPQRAAFAARLKEVSSGLTRERDVQTAGAVTLFRRAEVGDKSPKLVVRERGQDRVLINPNTASGSVVAINNYSLSPDGKRVAVHQAKGGGEVGEITVYEVATGKQVGPVLPSIWGEFSLMWLGGDWITYTQLAPAGTRADHMTGMRTFLKRVGDADAGRAIFGAGSTGPAFADKDFPRVRSAPWSPWALASGGGARADVNFWVVRKAGLLAGKPQWITVAGPDDQALGAEVLGDEVYLVTTKANGAGTLIRRAIGRKGLGAPTTVMAGHDQLIITDLAAAQDGLYLSAQTDGVSRLFHSPDGHKPFTEVKLPIEAGDLLDFRTSADGRGVSLGLTGWLSNAHSYRVIQGQLSDLGLGSQTWAGASGMQVERLQARSADGTQVPLVVLRAKGALPAGGLPTILEAYGAYGISSTTPYYARDFMAWLAQGGALAFCGTRGGGERGRTWHEAGRSTNKPTGHADFIACAQTLKARGMAPAKGVVAMGTSAGGLLVPPAALKEPGLFAALVPRVAVLNAARIGAAMNGANQFDEMGDPATPDGYKALVAMDAYHLLTTAIDMPDTLVTIGLNDKRVAPWMSAKFAARAQARFGAKRTVWLRAETDGGHGVGTAEDARVAEYADIFAFAWDRSR